MNIGTPNFILCSKCKAKYDVSGFKSGKKFKCQGCGETLTVPAFAEPVPAARPAGPKQPTRYGPVARPTARARAVQAAHAGDPDVPGEPRARRYGPQQSSNLPLIVSGIAVLVIIVVAVLFLKGGDGQDNQQQNQGTTTAAGGTSQSAGNQNTGTTQPTGSTGTTTNTGATTPGSGADTTSTQPTGTEPISQPGASPDQPTNPQPDTTQPGGETPKPPSTTKRGEFIVDHSIKGEIDNLLAEMPQASEEKIEEYSKVIEAYGDRAIPILIEALKNEDTMVANAASNLLRNITGYESLELKPGIDPEDAVVIYEQWKEWWCKYQFTYKRRKQERLDKMNAEKFQAEVVRHLGTYRHGTFSERVGAERKIKSLGTRVIPVLIELLCGEDTDLSTPSGALLTKFTGQEIGKSDQDMSELTPEERVGVKKKWEDWWEQNRDTFKMPE